MATSDQINDLLMTEYDTYLICHCQLFTDNTNIFKERSPNLKINSTNIGAALSLIKKIMRCGFIVGTLNNKVTLSQFSETAL